MTEADIQAAIMREIGGRPDVRLFRNNQGTGWVGRMVSHSGGVVVLANARPLHAGLFTGSGDLIGWTIRRRDGIPSAIFTSIEVKSSVGRPSDAQINWQAAIMRAGGIAGIVRSVEEASALVAP